jgi:Rrf2 family protein
MPHALQISRKIEYGTRAMVYLASLPDGMTTSFREIARRMDVPEEFLAKILKTLARAKLVKATRGAHGGYSLARPATQVTFLDVIEAVEGKITVNHCTQALGCSFSDACSMHAVWNTGQSRMLEVYRNTWLSSLAMRSLTHASPVVSQAAVSRADRAS